MAYEIVFISSILIYIFTLVIGQILAGYF